MGNFNKTKTLQWSTVFSGRVLNLNQSEASNQSFLASDWFRFVTLLYIISFLPNSHVRNSKANLKPMERNS